MATPFRKKKNKKNSDRLHLFKELFTLIYDDLFRFIFSIARNKHLAEDILQETAVIGYKKFHTLKDKDKFKSWIFTIAKRKAIEKIRKNRREVLSEPEKYQNIIKDENIEDTIFEDTLETHIAVVEAIKALPPEYREIINLVYYLGFSLKEIAKMTNTNYNTVKSRHLRALHMLKDALIDNNYTAK